MKNTGEKCNIKNNRFYFNTFWNVNDSCNGKAVVVILVH